MTSGLRALSGAFALVLLLAAAAVRPGHAQEHGVLRVGVVPGNQPWAFRDANNRLVGFEVDLSEEIAAGLELRAQFDEMGFGELFPALDAGEIDIAAASISISAERTARNDFTQPYYDSAQAVLVLKKSGIRTVVDLAGMTVGATSGTSNDAWLAANAARLGIGRRAFSPSAAQAARDLAMGRIDAYLGDLPALAYQQLRDPSLAVIGRLSTDEQYAIALRKGTPLTARVDAQLSRLKQNGTLARIHKRWFGMAPDRSSATATVLRRR